MLKFSYYNSIKQLKSISKVLVNLLNGTEDVSTENEEEWKQNKQNDQVLPNPEENCLFIESLQRKIFRLRTRYDDMDEQILKMAEIK